LKKIKIFDSAIAFIDMNLRSFVKVGNISNLSDARYCAGFGVPVLGFNVDTTSKDAIKLETAREIMGWVAVEDFVLECGQMDVAHILAMKDLTQLDYFQVDQIHTANELANLGLRVILRQCIENEDDLDFDGSQISTKIKYLLLESENESLFDSIHQKSKTLAHISLLKGFDVEAKNALDMQHFDGLALKGSTEEKPGFKDYEALANILEVLEE